VERKGSVREFWCGFICFVFAVVYLVASLFIRKKAITTLGAAFVPRIYGISLLLLSVMQMIAGKKAGIEEESGTKLERKDTFNVLYVFLLLFGYIVLMNVLGFIVTSTLYFFFQAVLLTPVTTKRRYFLYASISIVLSVSSFYVFHTMFLILLPTGMFF